MEKNTKIYIHIHIQCLEIIGHTQQVYKEQTQTSVAIYYPIQNHSVLTRIFKIN